MKAFWLLIILGVVVMLVYSVSFQEAEDSELIQETQPQSTNPQLKYDGISAGKLYCRRIVPAEVAYGHKMTLGINQYLNTGVDTLSQQ